MSVGAVRSCICVGMPRNRISFADICKKLNLGNPQDAEFICAKVNKHIVVSCNIFGLNVFVSVVAQRVYDLQTIRDGVINAVIDKKNNCLQSRVRACCSQMAYFKTWSILFCFRLSVHITRKMWTCTPPWNHEERSTNALNSASICTTVP